MGEMECYNLNYLMFWKREISLVVYNSSMILISNIRIVYSSQRISSKMTSTNVTYILAKFHQPITSVAL